MNKKLTSPARTFDGVVYQLKNLVICEELSEETLLFGGDLYADGKLIGRFKNDGHGASTFGYLEPGMCELAAKLNESLNNFQASPEEESLQHVMLNLDKLADMLAYDTLEWNEIKCKQANHLVLRKGRTLYIQKLAHPISAILSNERLATLLRKKMQDEEKDGFEIMNTNIKF